MKVNGGQMNTSMSQVGTTFRLSRLDAAESGQIQNTTKQTPTAVNNLIQRMYRKKKNESTSSFRSIELIELSSDHLKAHVQKVEGVPDPAHAAAEQRMSL